KHSGYGMNRLTPVQKMATTWFYSLNNLNLQKVTGTLQQHISCPGQTMVFHGSITSFLENQYKNIVFAGNYIRFI
ncbi:MAG: hypothetical protein PHU71_05680, partial [Candidatus Gracilibacteria bacterium]|nr:hypothetical protein [Candidatus Gracilibacteria bacterium]